MKRVRIRTATRCSPPPTYGDGFRERSRVLPAFRSPVPSEDLLALRKSSTLDDMAVCYECGQIIKTILFTIKYEDDNWPDGYICSIKCLDDFVVVAEAEAVLDRVV